MDPLWSCFPILVRSSATENEDGSVESGRADWSRHSSMLSQAITFLYNITFAYPFFNVYVFDRSLVWAELFFLAAAPPANFWCQSFGWRRRMRLKLHLTTSSHWISFYSTLTHANNITYSEYGIYRGKLLENPLIERLKFFSCYFVCEYKGKSSFKLSIYSL